NGIDLLSHTGPTGIAEESYGYESPHLLTRMTNAVGDVTSYAYNANNQITFVTNASGLVTENTYFGSGLYSNWLQRSVQLQINRINSYSYTNGLVFTHTDERGLTITNTWDTLERLRRVDYPD